MALPLLGSQQYAARLAVAEGQLKNKDLQYTASGDSPAAEKEGMQQLQDNLAIVMAAHPGMTMGDFNKAYPGAHISSGWGDSAVIQPNGKWGPSLPDSKDASPTPNNVTTGQGALPTAPEGPTISAASAPASVEPQSQLTGASSAGPVSAPTAEAQGPSTQALGQVANAPAAPPAQAAPLTAGATTQAAFGDVNAGESATDYWQRQLGRTDLSDAAKGQAQGALQAEQQWAPGSERSGLTLADRNHSYGAPAASAAAPATPDPAGASAATAAPPPGVGTDATGGIKPLPASDPMAGTGGIKTSPTVASVAASDATPSMTALGGVASGSYPPGMSPGELAGAPVANMDAAAPYTGAPVVMGDTGTGGIKPSPTGPTKGGDVLGPGETPPWNPGVDPSSGAPGPVKGGGGLAPGETPPWNPNVDPSANPYDAPLGNGPPRRTAPRSMAALGSMAGGG